MGCNPVRWESFGERDLCYLLEIDPTVRQFKDHPFKIIYVIDGNKRHYTPDMSALRESGKIQIFEVKDERHLDTEENRLCFQVGMQFCLERGYEYIVVTYAQLNDGYLLKNVKQLTRYRRQDIPYNCWLEMMAALQSGARKIGDLKAHLDSLFDINSLVYIYAALYRGLLRVEEDIKARPIDLDSFISLTKNNFVIRSD